MEGLEIDFLRWWDFIIDRRNLFRFGLNRIDLFFRIGIRPAVVDRPRRLVNDCAIIGTGDGNRDAMGGAVCGRYGQYFSEIIAGIKLLNGCL